MPHEGLTFVDLPDRAVDEALDAELRVLLSACFTGPDDGVFRSQRFFREPPRHRWLCRDERGIAAHVAAHDKTFLSQAGPIRVAGIAEVCVRTDRRGQGLVRALLARAHGDLARMGFAWAALLGRPAVYASSGYCPTRQPIRHRKEGGAAVVETTDHFQVARLRPDAPPWPTGELDLQGPVF